MQIKYNQTLYLELMWDTKTRNIPTLVYGPTTTKKQTSGDGFLDDFTRFFKLRLLGFSIPPVWSRKRVVDFRIISA